VYYKQQQQWLAHSRHGPSADNVDTFLSAIQQKTFKALQHYEKQYLKLQSVQKQHYIHHISQTM